MKPRLCRTPEGLIIYPGETVVIDQPLIGCFVTAALYSAAAVVTHCGPAMNDLTSKYHQELRPEPIAPARLICLNLDLATTTLWQRRRQEYRSAREELIALLAVSLHISPNSIESNSYPAYADIRLGLNQSAELKIDGLSK